MGSKIISCCPLLFLITLDFKKIESIENYIKAFSFLQKNYRRRYSYYENG